MALATIILHREGILAFVMTGAARFAGLHAAHRGFQGSGLVWEYPGVTIGTFVALQMKFVAEGRFTAISLELDDGWFQPFVAFFTIP